MTDNVTVEPASASHGNQAFKHFDDPIGVVNTQQSRARMSVPQTQDKPAEVPMCRQSRSCMPAMTVILSSLVALGLVVLGVYVHFQLEALMDHIHTLEIDSRAQRVKVEALEKEHASSYSALSTSLNNTRHIETGGFGCGNLSPDTTKDVTTTFSSPYTGAPPKVYVSVGGFNIRVTTDVSKYTALDGYLGHVDMEGFTFTCGTYSDSSYVREQHIRWMSFPTVV